MFLNIFHEEKRVSVFFPTEKKLLKFYDCLLHSYTYILWISWFFLFIIIFLIYFEFQLYFEINIVLVGSNLWIKLKENIYWGAYIFFGWKIYENQNVFSCFTFSFIFLPHLLRNFTSGFFVLWKMSKNFFTFKWEIVPSEKDQLIFFI